MRDITRKQFVLNGQQRQDHSRSFVHGGTKFVYSVQGDGETLSAPGPLMQDVHVMVRGGVKRVERVARCQAGQKRRGQACLRNENHEEAVEKNLES